MLKNTTCARIEIKVHLVLNKYVYGLKEMYFLDSQNWLHTIAELCVIVDDR